MLSADSYVYTPEPSSTNESGKTRNTNIIVLGDIMLGRSVMSVSLSKKDPNYPFEKVADRLKMADIVFANLETPVIENCPKSDSGFKFCADPEMLKGLVYAGVDMVNLANNHTGNYGLQGFDETKNYLKASGIDYVGDNNMIVKEINGTKFGFLGFDFVFKNPIQSDYKFISEAKSKVDILIVMVHWGNEYTPEPTTYQKSDASSLMGSGADVIIGSHPHWVQPIEHINGKPVIYSLGNFVFDQAWSEETRQGLAVNLIYSDKNLEQIEKMPVYMSSFAQPEWK